MHPLPISSETTPIERTEWFEPAAWRSVDDDVALTFADGPSAGSPQTLRWRGSSWKVVGASRYWSTWHCLAVEPAGDPPPTCRGLTTSFWRFAAQTDPVSPILHFEVRGTGDTWRLVRLGVDFGLPAPL